MYIPGSDAVDDRVEYRYNRQGERIEMVDQNGTIHRYEYDSLGRMTTDSVVSFGADVDDSVKRIETSYEVRGMVQKVTSFSDASGGAGNIVNELAYEYDGLGKITTFAQDHSDAVDANSPSVGYTYDTTTDSGAYTNGPRRTKIEYPNGRLIHYGYLGAYSQAANRVDQLLHDNGSGSPGSYFVGSSPEFVGIGRLFPGGSTPRPRGIYRMEANPGEREKRERDDEGRPVSGLGPWSGARVASQQSPILRPGHEPL